MLKEIVAQGTEAQREMALRTIDVSEQLRAQRQTA